MVLASESEKYRFVGKRVASQQTGLSGDTLKKYRRIGKLIKGIHWIALNSRTVRYNLPLLMDWLQNEFEPAAHQRAIDAYLAALPSNQPKKKGRKAEQ